MVQYLESVHEKTQSPEWLYYKGTNCFCGPIELRDARGKAVRLLEPQVSQAEAYPAQYRWHTEYSNASRRGYIGPGTFPEPLLGAVPFSEIVRLKLARYFSLTEPGEYKFTVWPKVYKRSEKDKDLCERIDLPPVSVTIKWEPGGE